MGCIVKWIKWGRGDYSSVAQLSRGMFVGPIEWQNWVGFFRSFNNWKEWWTWHGELFKSNLEIYLFIATAQIHIYLCVWMNWMSLYHSWCLFGYQYHYWVNLLSSFFWRCSRCVQTISSNLLARPKHNNKIFLKKVPTNL